MFRFLVAACAGLAAVSLAGCGTPDMSGSPATGAPDGGSVGTSDGGTGTDGGSGNADAGTGADGGGGGGTAATCTQPGFPSVGARNYVIDPAGRDPVYSAADSTGTLLFGVTGAGSAISGNEAALVSPDGNTKSYLSFTRGARLHADPAGFSGVFGGFSGSFSVRHLDSDGKQTGEVGYNLADDARFAATMVADPRSGTLVLGKFRRSDAQGDVASFRAAFVTSASTELWSLALANTVGVIFGAGLDLSGNAIVITDGSARFGSGAISGQWISSSGKDLTGEFQLLSGFQAGSNTWFETSALAGGGVAIRRVDASDPAGVSQSSQYLCVVGAGATGCAAPPAWLAAHRNVRIEPVRGAAAYAALPDPGAVPDCKQTVELIDANGATCGSMDLPMASGACTTRPLAVGKDGTLIQPLADRAWSCGPGDRPCRATWRWWPGLLR